MSKTATSARTGHPEALGRVRQIIADQMQIEVTFTVPGEVMRICRSGWPRHGIV